MQTGILHPRGLHTGAKSEAELVTCEYSVRLVTCE